MNEHTNIQLLQPEILNFALESSLNAVAFADLQGNLTYINDAFLRMWGYTAKSEVLSRSVLEFWQEPDMALEVVEALQKDGIWQGSLVAKKNDQTFFDAQLAAHIVKNKEANPIGLMASFQDVTDRKKNEIRLQESKRMFQAIAMTAQDAIVLMDQKGLIQFWNPAAEKIFGYSYQEVMGKDLHGILMPQHYRSQFEPAFAHFQETGNGARLNKVTKLKARLRNGDELSVELSLSSFPMQGETWVAGIVRDVSQQIQYEKDLIRAKEEAIAASKAKSDFLANMSHEIRTPLNGVIGFLDLLMETKMEQTQRLYLDTAKSSAYALLDIISDILDFSKIEAGKLELNIESTDLVAMIEQTADIVKHRAHQKGLEFLLNMDARLPRYVQADSVRLRQVLVNLLSNAVKFTDQGEIELQVVFDEKDKSIVFAVRDSGIGIKEEDKKMIFDSFSQVESSSVRRFGGTGLGLTISNSLLEKMESHLRLDSQYGQGSTFSFQVFLPIEKDQTIVTNHNIEMAKALIVDDNENNRIIVQEMLRLKNISSDQAASGEDAIAMYQKYADYDVVIVDYHMPYMDGLEVIQKIRDFNKSRNAIFIEKQNEKQNEKPDKTQKETGDGNSTDIDDQIRSTIGGKQPILFLHSSSDDSMILEECRRLNVQCVMIKPVKMQELFQNLASLSNQIVKEKQDAQTDGHGTDQNDSEMLDESGQPKSKANQSNALSKEKFKILIAEDNNVNMTLASLIVSKVLPEAIIYKAYDGAEALQCYRDEKPDLIFMDIQMPKMNGYEVTKSIRQLEIIKKQSPKKSKKDGKKVDNRTQKQLKKNSSPQKSAKKVPIIALTAGTIKGDRERCFSVGMDDYVSKPFALRTIYEKIEKYLPQISH